jgi:hypothetical protein
MSGLFRISGGTWFRVLGVRLGVETLNVSLEANYGELGRLTLNCAAVLDR